MEQIITKEVAKQLMAMKGETRGLSIKGDVEYVRHKFGQEGINKIEAEMEKLGFPVEYEKMKQMDFYPVGLEALTIVVMKKIFNFKENDYYAMGAFNSKLSFIVRLFMRYFVSLEVLAKESKKLWKKYYTVGEFKVLDIDKDKKCAIARIDNFGISKEHCHSVRGFLTNLVQMAVNRPVKCEETKCIFSGDDHHEFSVNW